MKLERVLRYLGLLMVGLLAGNALVFALATGSTVETLSASSYLVFHESVRRSFLAWTPMLSGLLILILFVSLIEMRRHWKHLEFALILLTLLCVADELFMSWTGYNSLNGTSLNWSLIQQHWMQFMYWRCILPMVGFGFLLTSVCIKKSVTPSSLNVVAAA